MRTALRRALIPFLAVCCGLPAVAPAQPTTAPATAPAGRAERQPADEPAPGRDANGEIGKRFAELHAKYLERTKGGPVGLLFVGDSITEYWVRPAHVKDFEARYAKYDAANFAVAGDTTQWLLWRLVNGELEGIKPKVVVLLIGTNNAGTWTADEIFAGIKANLDVIREKLPESKVLLLGIFPRGERNDKAGKPIDFTPQRTTSKAVNARLPSLADGKTVRYLELSHVFLPDGGEVVPADIMPDGVHLSLKGYQLWGDAMQPTLDEMWGDGN